MSMPYVKLYALSTCSHCKAVKRLLEEARVPYEAIDVDLLQSGERRAILDEVKQLSQRLSFPVTVIGDQVVVGDKADQIRAALENSFSSPADPDE